MWAFEESQSVLYAGVVLAHVSDTLQCLKIVYGPQVGVHASV